MLLISPYTPNKVIEILKEEIDSYPSMLRSILTLNAHYYQGTSEVCGKVDKSEFILKNRNGPGFSLIAKGKVTKNKGGTEIEINFEKSILNRFIGIILFNRFEYDQEVILTFLKKWLKTKEK